MRVEPAIKRAVAFVDGQNLFHAAREAFGYTYPNYDVVALARAVCERASWQLATVRFYTGVPDARDNDFWNGFWTHKLAMMGRQAVHTFSRPLRYRNRRVKLPDGSQHTYLAGEEKGIDVRIAIDVIRMAHRSEYDVAVIFSQDQDLSEAAGEIRAISREQDRWIKIASAFPASLLARNTRGIERATYDACIDRRDYRQRPDSEEERS